MHGEVRGIIPRVTVHEIGSIIINADTQAGGGTLCQPGRVLRGDVSRAYLLIYACWILSFELEGGDHCPELSLHCVLSGFIVLLFLVPRKAPS